METALYIVVLIIALGFAAGVGFLAKILLKLKTTISNVADMVENVKGHVTGIAAEGTEMLHKTNKLVTDINEKAARMNPVVDNFKDVGDKLIDFSGSVKTTSHELADAVEQNEDQAAQAMNWGIAGVQLYQKANNEKATQ